MAQIIVRNLDDDVIKRLKKRAKKNKRSLESEIRFMLGQASSFSHEDALKLADRIRKRFKGRKLADSAELIREERDR